jgi:hypothetical protein
MKRQLRLKKKSRRTVDRGRGACRSVVPEGETLGNRVKVELSGLVELLQRTFDQQLAVGPLGPVTVFSPLCHGLVTGLSRDCHCVF